MFDVLKSTLWIAAWLGVFVLVGRSTSQEHVPASNGYREIAEQLDRLIRHEVRDKNLPAVSIALIDDQEIVWATGFGFEDVDQQRPANAMTVYRVGSVSKLFTDLAIMQLVEQDKIDLDDDVRNFIPTFQPDTDPETTITLRKLMAHRSGLVRESPVGNYFDPDEPSIESTVLSLNGLSLTYPDQQTTKYSNAGIAVVGYVLETILDQPFSEAINDRLIDPLGMTWSSFELSDRLQSRLARAEMWTHDGRTFDAPLFKLGTLPAGNLYSNTIDLAKFVSAVFNQGVGENGAIIEPNTLDSMLSPQFADAQGNASYGIGFHLSELDGHKMIGHGGAVYGYSTQLHAIPDLKIGIVIATSKDGANDTMRYIATHALRCMIAKNDSQPLPTTRVTTVVPPERALRLVGLYRAENDHNLSLRILRRNDELYARYQSYRFRVRALDDSTLIADDCHRRGMMFEILGPDRIRLQGRDFVRSEDPQPEPLPDRWKGLVGEYGWDHNTLYVFEDQGKLHCLVEWFYYYPLEEVSENQFAFPNYGLYHGEQLIFERDDDGVAHDVVAAEVRFTRRETGTIDGATFTIDPILPIDEVRRIAMDSEPPNESSDFRDSDLVEVTALDDSIKLDIRYASTNNFMQSVFYQQPRAFMQRPAAEALVRAHQHLKQHGYGLLIHDAYRPWFVTKMFWEATPGDLKLFVANPASGSRHNRGCAVDLTLYDLESGEPIPMGAGYDEFSVRSYPDYEVETSSERWHRELLRSAMEAQGFTIYEFEWWHFDYGDWRQYAIQNQTFEELD